MAVSFSSQHPRRESLFVPVGDYDIFVEIDGQGPCMIMTHGLGSSTNAFQPFTLNKSGAKLTVPYLVAIIKGVIFHLKVSGAILIGHSAGGCASMIAAAEYPELIRGLAVIGSGRTRSNQPEAKAFTLSLAQQVRETGNAMNVDERVNYNIPKTSPALSRALLRSITAKTIPEGYAQMCEALCADSHIDPDYSQITCPTCVIGGNGDAISPISVTDELVQLIATSGKTPSKHLLQTGHMMIIEDIEGTVKSISSMLAQI